MHSGSRDVEGYLYKRALNGKEERISSPRLEVGGCREEVCGGNCEVDKRFFSVLQK